MLSRSPRGFSVFLWGPWSALCVGTRAGTPICACRAGGGTVGTCAMTGASKDAVGPGCRRGPVVSPCLSFRGGQCAAGSAHLPLPWPPCPRVRSCHVPDARAEACPLYLRVALYLDVGP